MRLDSCSKSFDLFMSYKAILPSDDMGFRKHTWELTQSQVTKASSEGAQRKLLFTKYSEAQIERFSEPIDSFN